MKDFDYSVNDLIIGNTLPAFLYSFIHNVPLIYNRNNYRSPLPFEFYDRDKHLDVFYIPYERNDFVFANKDYKSFGIQKIDLYDRLGAVLALAGNIRFGDKIENIFLCDDLKTIEVSTCDLQRYSFKYKKLLIFDIEGLSGLDANILKREEKKYVVADWWNVRSGQKHPISIIEDDNLFVKTIFFYRSIRVDGPNRTFPRKDCVSVSYLTETELNDIVCSESFSSLKTRKMMKEAGIRGGKNGHFRGGYQYITPLKIEIDKRELRKLNHDIVCENKENIEFHYEDDLSLIRYHEEVYRDITSYPYILNKVGFEKWQRHVRKNSAVEYKTFLFNRNHPSAPAGKI